ncbi:hypothetical protein [Rhodococcus sp. AQ5-07]|uniref:hypothetical protein n=1 Tax=Rhodococcus sp. AQ5-07 TaxID=2054902 RepID=UPI000DBFB0F7|nr:hypothetical protein [Rhodococcus sp. AQ5-07]RAL31501.1 hypothetical protein CVN56_27765 [Rhodococcus sp. AQ5-07]
MITISIEGYDGPTEESYVAVDRNNRWTQQVMVTRDEWTALPPTEYLHDWLHPDRIEARIFERMGGHLRYSLGIRLQIVNVTEKGIHLWLPMDYHPEHLGMETGEVFTPIEQAVQKVVAAKDRAVAEERDAIREWLFREQAARKYFSVPEETPDMRTAPRIDLRARNHYFT